MYLARVNSFFSKNKDQETEAQHILPWKILDDLIHYVFDSLYGWKSE